MGGSLRTPETAQKYIEYIAEGGLAGECVLCKSPALHDFTYWKIIDNKFPYDRVASKHHMLIPKRHAIEKELTEEEEGELRRIKHEDLIQSYQFVAEAMHHAKSIPEHFHLHLVIIKD